LKLRSIPQLIYHLKILHNLGKESYYYCKQPFCYRDFRGLHKFRQHLNRSHIKNQGNNKNHFSQFTNSESNEYTTITNDPLNKNINYTQFHNLDSFTTFITHTNYELSEQSVLLNELVSSDDSHDTEIINLPPFKIKVEKIVLSFVANLMTKSNVTGSLLQEIIEGIINMFSSDLIVYIKKEVLLVMRQFNSSKYSEIENMFEVVENSFSSVKTEYHQTKTFLKHNVFFKPDTIVVGYTKEKKTVEGHDKILMVPVQAHLPDSIFGMIIFY